MPIILLWNTAAFPSAPLVKRLLDEMNIASLSLEEGLKKRFDDAKKAERLTSAFPVFRFTDEALSAYVTRAQFGLAMTEPPKGWGDRLASLGPYWDLPKEIGNRIRESELLPGLFHILRTALAAISVSVTRFEKPFKGMFDEGVVSAVDLAGMGALAFKSVGKGRVGILARFTALRDGLAETNVIPATGDMTAPPPDLPLADPIDEFARYVVGAIILVPAVAALAIELLPAIEQAIRHIVIGKLVDIEAQVLDLRATVLAKLSHSVAAYAQAAIGLAGVAQDYALAHLKTWVSFTSAYLSGLFRGVSVFVTQLTTFFEQVRGLAASVIDFANRILAIDLTDLIHKTLVALQYLCDLAIHTVYDKDEKPERYVAPASYSVTLGQLIMGEGGGDKARQDLAKGTGRLHDLLKGSITLMFLGGLGAGSQGINLSGLMKGLEQLGSVLMAPVRDAQDQPTLALSSATPPDLVKLIIDPAEKGLTSILANLATALNTFVQETASGLTKMLNSAGDAFDEAADKAARLGLGWAFGRIAGNADEIAATTFPLEALSAIPPTLGPLAQQFAAAVSGGFRTMEGVIGGFLGFVLEEWRAHLDENADTPVEVNEASPRKLLARARLGRVHLPEMVLHLEGHPLTQATATLVAQRFVVEIRGAYQRGEARLAGWQAAAAG